MTTPSPLRAELLRKALHLGTATLPLTWSAGLITTSQLRLLLASAVAVALAVEAARRASPSVARGFEASVGGLLRGHEQAAITGATWLAIAMAGVVWLAPERAALAALWAAAVGDASAALVGRWIGARRAAPTGQKSWQGSLAALLSTAVGGAWLAGATWPQALLLGGAAALAEYPRRPLDDNLRVATAVAIAATALGLR